MELCNLNKRIHQKKKLVWSCFFRIAFFYSSRKNVSTDFFSQQMCMFAMGILHFALSTVKFTALTQEWKELLKKKLCSFEATNGVALTNGITML